MNPFDQYELHVQTFLRQGGTIADLKTKFGIKSDEDDKLVLLNYDQIESPKSDPIVMECRGTVLEKGTWNVIYYPFKRFFNYGEMPELVKSFGPDFIENAVALEKVDGSMIGFWFYGGEWNVSTRGTLHASGTVNMGNFTFEELFSSIATSGKYPNFLERINTSLMYTFELVSPENRVVTPYTERKLYLINVRSRETLQEADYVEIKAFADLLGVESPKVYPFTEIAGLFELAKGMSKFDEGFVCVGSSRYDGFNHGRIKVKNPAYLAIAHMKDSAGSSLRGLMMLVMQGEYDEFLSYFPEYRGYVEKVQAAYTQFIAEVNAGLDSVRELLPLPRTPDNRKEFALRARVTRNPAILFTIYDGRAESVKDAIAKNIVKNGAKKAGKDMLEMCKVKDIDMSAKE